MQSVYRIVLGLSLSTLPLAVHAQSVGVGTTTPDANAALDISAGAGNNKGLLIPRMTELQRTAVTTTSEGMLVYQTNGAQPGFWYFSGGVWVALPSGVASGSGWLRTGNSGTDPGTYTGVGQTTNSGTSFLGTTDNKDLVFRTGNAERFRITTDGSLYSRSTFGLILNARDAPMLTRGWDPFTAGDYNGLGRWGMFMLSSRLALGIPSNIGSFSWVTWNTNSSIDKTLMTLQNGGNLGIGITDPTTRLSVVGTGSANPFTSGAAQSAGHIARFRDNGDVALDLGSSGADGNWLQSTNPTNLSTNYALRLNPNGGNVGIGTGTVAPSTKLEVAGQVKITGGTPGAGKVLTSDAAGLATWQTPAASVSNMQTTNTFAIPTTGTGTLNATTGVVILPNNGGANGGITLGAGANGQTLTITNLDADAVSITSTSGTGSVLPNYAAQFVYVVNGTTSGWFRVN